MMDGRTLEVSAVAGCCASNNTVAGLLHRHRRSLYPHLSGLRYRRADALGGHSLQQACVNVIHDALPELSSSGGLIAVDRLGNVAPPFNSEGMYHGVARVGEEVGVGIYREG